MQFWDPMAQLWINWSWTIWVGSLFIRLFMLPFPLLHKKGKKFLKKEKEKKTKQNCYCCLNAAQCIEVER